MKKFMKVIGLVLTIAAFGVIGYMIMNRHHADNVEIQSGDWNGFP